LVRSWSHSSPEPFANSQPKSFSEHRQGLPVRCVANLDNVLTVPRQRLKRLMEACDVDKMAELNPAIKAAFDVP
jgi:mRNA-degrading endonuclease toxin of MazEF toxin-antitoxin module